MHLILWGGRKSGFYLEHLFNVQICREQNCTENCSQILSDCVVATMQHVLFGLSLPSAQTTV